MITAALRRAILAAAGSRAGPDADPLTVMRVVRYRVQDYTRLERLRALIVELTQQPLPVDEARVRFDAVIRALGRIGYQGPLSVEWEDPEMDREHGAAEAAAFVRRLDFPAAGQAFDAAFAKKREPPRQR